jgi:hypothetical protein
VVRTGARGASISKGVTLTRDELEFIGVDLGEIVNVRKSNVRGRRILVVSNYREDESES